MKRKQPPPIGTMTVSATLDGPIEEVLAELSRLPASCGATRGYVRLAVPRRWSGVELGWEYWYVQSVAQGDASGARNELLRVARKGANDEQIAAASEAIDVLEGLSRGWADAA